MITALLGSVLIISPASRAADDEKKDEKPAAGARGGARGDRLAQMAKELDLTDAQKEKIKPILQDQAKAMAELRDNKDLSREDRMAKMKEMRDGMTAKLKPILTPEQLEKWTKMRAQGPRRQPQGQ